MIEFKPSSCRNIYETTDAELRQIERDEAHNVELPPPTVLSVLQYVLGCFKFYLMPRPLRYLWYHIWTRLRAVYYPYHKRLVLKGQLVLVYLCDDLQPLLLSISKIQMPVRQSCK